MSNNRASNEFVQDSQSEEKTAVNYDDLDARFYKWVNYKTINGHGGYLEHIEYFLN